MLKYFSILLLWISIFDLSGQQGMLQWREHLPYSKVIEVVATDEFVFAATPFSMIRYDKNENFAEKINTINALSDFGLSAMNYDPLTKWVILGYSNGNVDLIKDDQTYNLPSIKNSNISGSKRINMIEVVDSLVYICTDFGVVLLDIHKFEYRDAYYPYTENIKVFDIDFWNDSIYLSTSEGLFRADQNNPFLIDNNSWEPFSQPFGITDSVNTLEIEIFQNQMYLVQDSKAFGEDTLWKHNGTQWESVQDYENLNINRIKAKDNQFLISLIYNARSLDENFEVIENIYEYTFGALEVNSFDVDSENTFWIADDLSGLVKAKNSFSNESVSPPGPYAAGSYKMDYSNGKIGVAGGALTSNFSNNFSNDGFYVFEDENWTSYNVYNQQALQDSAYDYTSIAIDPVDGSRMFVGSSSQKGLFRVIGNEIVEWYNKDNSTLQEQNGNPGKYNIHDLQIDENQTLWATNGLVTEPLLAMDINNEWYSFNLGSQATNKTTQRVYVDFFKNKWVAVRGFGLVAFNENGTLGDVSDDDIAYFSEGEGSGNLPADVVNDMEMDFNNHLWIGTDNGLAVIYNVEQIYDEDANVEAQRILIDDGINVEALLGGVGITSIDVDGANRKWIGTFSSGVFCLSPDGSEEIYRFTQENSPLFSNAVIDVRVNHETGEVFFATESGLLSFRTDATYGDFEFENVKVFPNPVHPTFEGPVSIQGVAYDSDVKIMDPAGRMVFQTTSNGGTIIWDGNLPDGTRASTGVYVVLVGEKQNKGRVATKIMFLN